MSEDSGPDDGMREHVDDFERRMEEIERRALRNRLKEWSEESSSNSRDLMEAYQHGCVDALNQAATLIEWFKENDPIDLAGALRAISGRKEDRLPVMFRQLRFGDERLYSRDVLYRVIPHCTPNKLAAMKRRHALVPDVQLSQPRRCVGYRWRSVRTAFTLSEEWRSRLDEAADAIEKQRNNEALYRQMELDGHVRQERLGITRQPL